MGNLLLYCNAPEDSKQVDCYNITDHLIIIEDTNARVRNGQILWDFTLFNDLIHFLGKKINIYIYLFKGL